MRRVRYAVAVSLDGYIAGPAGEYDWIPMDPSIDFAAFFKPFDTVLMGRKTFETTLSRGPPGGMPGMTNYVFSRTLAARDHPKMTVAADAATTVAALRAEAAGKDIWLMGGGVLFRSLADAGLVDTVELSVVPILLGGGIPLVPPGPKRVPLELTESKTFPSGRVSLSYSIRGHTTADDSARRDAVESGKARSARRGREGNK
jgi:dihydrofolate reductase